MVLVLEICPRCGSTDYIKDYPEQGRDVCENCGSDIKKVPLVEKDDEEELPDNCPLCGEKLEEDPLCNWSDMYIEKCGKCGNLVGYRFLGDDDWFDDPFADDDRYDSLQVEIAGQEGKSIYSASWAKRYLKEVEKHKKKILPITECIKRADKLLAEKRPQLEEAGIGPGVIEDIRRDIHYYLEQEEPFTDNQLRQIIAAYFSRIQKAEQAPNRTRLEKEVTDGQLEKIFSTTRKTIRKWRDIVRQDEIFLHETEMQFKASNIYGRKIRKRIILPDHIMSYSTIRQPETGTCNRCGELKRLIRLLTFKDNSSSQICQKCAEEVEIYLKESQYTDPVEFDKVVDRFQKWRYR
ncbi:MAG: hypothetical protein QG670_827 [Thermoproteota archaeon]|nr:hypothetical protein [Thermoproteota archaeon]